MINRIAPEVLGSLARDRGVPLDGNPFAAGTDARLMWALGWWEL